MRLRNKKLGLILAIAFLSLGLMITPQQTQGAAATAASIELSADTFVEDTLMTVRVYDVTASGASFNLYFTYDLSGTDTLEAKTEYANITVYLGSDEDEWVYSMLFVAPTAGGYIQAHVCGTAAGTTTDLCADTAYSRAWDDLWPGDFLIEVGIDIMIALLIVGIIVAVSTIGAKKLHGRMR